MDRIDRQIIHCLQRDGRAPFRRIADVLAVSEQTVARRFRALQAGGVLRVLVLPDAEAAGQQTWFVRIQCRLGSSDALAEAIGARADVSWVSITSGGGELVCVVRSDPQQRSSAGSGVLLDRLPRTSEVLSFTAYVVLHKYVGGEAEWLAFDDPLSAEQIAALHHDRLAQPGRGWPPPANPPSGILRSDDAPLLAALARDGRAGVLELSRAIGWPQSRVAARLELLLTSGAVRIDVDLAPAAFGFRSHAYLWLTVAPGELAATAQALSVHPETSFAAVLTGAANVMTAVNCRDSDALYTYVTTKVGALPAIRAAEIVPVLRRVKQAGTQVRNERLHVTPPGR